MLGSAAVAKVHLEIAETKRSLHCRRDRSHGESSRSAKQKSNPGEVDELHLAQIKDDCLIGQATQLGFECVHVREVYVASHLDQTVPVLSVGLNVQLRGRHEDSHPWLPFDVQLRSPRSEPCSNGTPLRSARACPNAAFWVITRDRPPSSALHKNAVTWRGLPRNHARTAHGSLGSVRATCAGSG